MKKTKSFSQYGTFLERRTSLANDPQLLEKTAQRAKQRPLVVSKSQPKFIEGFDRVIPREKHSPFTMFHTKDKNVNTNYEVKQKQIQTRHAFYPTRRESEVRLNKLIVTKEKYEKNQHVCHKHGTNERDQNIMTTRDLQKTRKSFHSMDFDKQLAKSYSYIKIPEGRQTLNAEQQQILANKMNLSGRGNLNISKKDPYNKTQKIHSFDSYTNRDFLSQKKLSKKGAPPFSGIQAFKIPPQKFKGSWKVIQPPKFQHVPNKTITRYDGESSWNTKLGYHPKEELVKKKSLVFDMRTHSPRKMNQVHSKYPFRLAV